VPERPSGGLTTAPEPFFHVTGAIVPTLQQYILGHLLGRLFESRDIVGDVVLSFCVIKQHVNVCEDT